jgi:hypothetical protein
MSARRVAAAALALGLVAAAGCGPKAGAGAPGGGGAGGGGAGGGGAGGGGAGDPRGRAIEAELLPDDADDDPLATTLSGIKDEVGAIKSGKHALMPKAVKAKGKVADPVVDVRNLTRAPLTVWFSGECARKITVPPDSRARAVLCPGDYVTAARIENPDILPFIGDQHLDFGAVYTLSFYIAKEPIIEKKKGGAK